MPFDNPMTSAALGVVDKMLTLLATPDKWLKGADFYIDSYCLMGALRFIDRGNPWEPFGGRYIKQEVLEVHCILNKILKERGSHLSVGGFNDHFLTKHKDIIELLQEARSIILDKMENGHNAI